MSAAAREPDSEVPAPEGPAPTTTPTVDNVSLADGAYGSQQVCWWTVHEFVSPLLTIVESWPTIGTPAWRDLAPDDLRKVAAVFDAARHWALQLESNQVARCEAGEAISAAADWPAIAERIRGRAEFFTERPWLRRESAR